MIERISPAEYRDRRDRYMAMLGRSTAILSSAPPAIMHNTVEYPFRQDSSFLYLSGWAEEGAVMVLAPHHEEHRFILFVRPKDWEQEVWSGYRWGVEQAQEIFGADVAYPIAELPEKLPQYLLKAETIHYRLGQKHDNLIIKMLHQGLRQYQKTGLGPTAIVDPMPTLSRLRQVKSPAELEIMRYSAQIASKAHNHAREIAAPGRYEYEIAAEIEHIFRLAGGGPAYPSIVASGANSCILHYIANNRQMQAGDVLLIDAGCAYDYYNSDITRTFPVGGQFRGEQRAIYEIVLAAQEAAIAQVQPGNAYHQFHEAAVQVITEGLVSLGLLQGDLEELVKEQKYKPFFMHGTGHWLGLDVHDVGIYRRSAEEGEILQAGEVTTVEPGIYIGPETKPLEGQPEIADRWRGIGIRIEDDVLVTSTGHEILTAAVPKTLDP
jgi:Xaa-Pro aminopeptidase